MKARVFDALDKVAQFLKFALLSMAVILTTFSGQLFANTVYVPNQTANSIALIDTNTNTIVGTITGLSTPLAVIFSPDQKFAYVTVSSGVSVIDTTTSPPQVINTIAFPTSTSSDAPNGIAITPDGTTLYVATTDIVNFNATVTVYNLVTQVLTVIPIGTPFDFGIGEGIAITPDGSTVYAANGNSTDNVFRIDTATNTVIGSPITVATVQSFWVAITPDGTAAYVTGVDGHLSKINTTTLAVQTITVGSSDANGLAITPNSTAAYVAATSGTSGNLVRVDTTTNPPSVTNTIPILTGITDFVAITPDGKFAYVDTNTSSVYVVSTASNTVVAGPIHVPGGTNLGALAIGPPLVVPVTITPPTNLTGVQKKNDFGILYELFNFLQWQQGTTTAASYNIYRNGVLIASVDGTVFKYEDHDRKKGVATTYSVTAVNSSGAESSAVTVVVQG